MRSRILLLFVFGAAIGLAANDLPFAGKWAVNYAKSDFGSTTITYTALPSGEWRSTADGHSYNFRLDEKDYSDGLGSSTAWKSVGANTWQTTWKLNGKQLTTDTLRLGADGILTVSSKGTKPNGEPIDETTTFQRISGGPGLAGKWKTKGVQSGSADIIEFAASEGSRLAFKEPAMGMTCDGKLNGKNYACSGPTLAPGWAIAMTKTGARSLTLVVKKDSKPFYRFAYVVSADGKMLTATGGAAATTEKIKIVYDRQ